VDATVDARVVMRRPHALSTLHSPESMSCALGSGVHSPGSLAQKPAVCSVRDDVRTSVMLQGQAVCLCRRATSRPTCGRPRRQERSIVRRTYASRGWMRFRNVASINRVRQMRVSFSIFDDSTKTGPRSAERANFSNPRSSVLKCHKPTVGGGA